jgi:hypothetical protein
MNNEMLNRIKNRSQRPTVKRDTSLEPSEPQQPSETLPASHQTSEQESTSKTEAEQLKQQLEACPKIAPRRNIRLEESLNQKIQQFCHEEQITMETFLEACFLACEQDDELKHLVTQEARKRVEQRKEAGKLRRLFSQLEKLGD